jgi:hypothetical protein
MSNKSNSRVLKVGMPATGEQLVTKRQHKLIELSITAKSSTTFVYVFVSDEAEMGGKAHP